MTKLSFTTLIFCSLGLGSLSNASETLLQHSPFLPPSYSLQRAPKQVEPSNQQPPSERFEFRGVVRFGEQYEFSIYDIQSKDSKWLSPGETKNGYRIISYHPGMRELSFVWNGRSGRLKLNTEDEIPLAIQQSLKIAKNSPHEAKQSESSAVNRSDRYLSASQQRALALTGGNPSKDDRSTVGVAPNGPIRFAPFSRGGGQDAFYRQPSAFASIGDAPSAQNDGSELNASGIDASDGPRSIFRRNKVHNPNGKIPRG